MARIQIGRHPLKLYAGDPELSLTVADDNQVHFGNNNVVVINYNHVTGYEHARDHVMRRAGEISIVRQNEVRNGFQNVVANDQALTLTFQ